MVPAAVICPGIQVPADGDTGGGGGGESQEASHAALITRAPRSSRVFTAYPARKSLRSGTGGGGRGYGGGESLALKEITRRGSRAEAAPCRTSPGGDVFVGFAGKKPFGATTFTDEGTKAKGALQRSHSAELGAATAACGAATEDGRRELVSGQPITVAPSTRDLQNSLAALRPQPPGPAIEGGHQVTLHSLFLMPLGCATSTVSSRFSQLYFS